MVTKDSEGNVKMSEAVTRLLEVISTSRRLANQESDDSARQPEWLKSGTVRHVSGLEELEFPFLHREAEPVFSNSDVFYSFESNPEDDHLARDSQGVPYKAQPELLAWYRTFRNPGWGIYIRLAGIETVAKAIYGGGLSPNQARSLAFDFLFEHEFTHFRSDLTIAGIENLASTHLWMTWRKSLQAKNAYSHQAEGLCNSHAFYKVPKNYREPLAKWLALSPPGYSDYASHPPSPLGRHSSWSELLGEVAGKPTHSFYPFQPNVTYLRALVPVYFVYEPQTANTPTEDVVYFFGAMPVSEDPAFEKALIKSGNKAVLAKKWQKTKGMLQTGALTSGLNLEQYSKKIFTVRVDQQTRAILELLDGNQWRALEISQDHDAINKRAARA